MRTFTDTSRGSTTLSRSSSERRRRAARRCTHRSAGTWPMADRRPRIRRRSLESYNKTWLGINAVVPVAIVIAALLLVKQAGIGYQRYTAQFQQAASLKADDIVSVAGIPVGSVTDVRLAGDHVEARIRVRSDVPVGRDARAA